MFFVLGHIHLSFIKKKPIRETKNWNIFSKMSFWSTFLKEVFFKKIFVIHYLLLCMEYFATELVFFIMIFL